jgi:hypothetical protein
VGSGTHEQEVILELSFLVRFVMLLTGLTDCYELPFNRVQNSGKTVKLKKQLSFPLVIFVQGECYNIKIF